MRLLSSNELNRHMESVVCGHHIYKAIWTPQLAEYQLIKKAQKIVKDITTKKNSSQ